ALAHTIHSLAQKSGSSKLNPLNAHLAKVIPEPLLRTNIQSINFREQGPLFENDPVSTMIYTNIVKACDANVDLSSAMLQPLENLRLFAAPSSTDSALLEWQLYFEGDKRFEKISKAEDLGRVMRSIFSKIARVVTAKDGKPDLGKAVADYLKILTNQEIAREFERYFLPYLSRQFTTDTPQKPWSFLLTSENETILWSTYFQTPQQVTEQTLTTITIDPDEKPLPMIEWAEKMRKTVGKSPEIAIPARFPGHVFRCMPNHPSMICPEGQTKEAWLEKK